MEKQQLYTSFSELTDTELKQITGGNWWTEFIGNFHIPKPRLNSEKKHLMML